MMNCSCVYISDFMFTCMFIFFCYTVMKILKYFESMVSKLFITCNSYKTLHPKYFSKF